MPAKKSVAKTPATAPVITPAKVELSRRLGRVMSKIPFDQQDKVRTAYERSGSWAKLPADVKKLVTDAEKGSGAR